MRASADTDMLQKSSTKCGATPARARQIHSRIPARLVTARTDFSCLKKPLLYLIIARRSSPREHARSHSSRRQLIAHRRRSVRIGTLCLASFEDRERRHASGLPRASAAAMQFVLLTSSLYALKVQCAIGPFRAFSPRVSSRFLPGRREAAMPP